MLISISTSGGMLGTGVPGGGEKTVDTQTLSETAREEVCRYFDPKELAKLAKPRNVESADRFTYHVTVSDADGRKHSFNLSEGAMPAEMLDLIDGF
jgi:hypothetical protein